MARLKFRISAATDTGGRPINQDSLLMDEFLIGNFQEPKDFSCKLKPQKGRIYIFAVSDGISSGSVGEEVSREAVQILWSEFREINSKKQPVTAEILSDIAARINVAIIAYYRKRGYTSEFAGGCTISFLVVDGSEFWAVNVGDSPIYLLRGNEMKILSVEHTIAALKRRNNDANIRERDKHALVNYIGNQAASDFSQADILHDTIKPSDTFILSSDGILGIVDFGEMMKISNTGGNIARALVDASLKGNTQDNITAVVVSVE